MIPRGAICVRSDSALCSPISRFALEELPSDTCVRKAVLISRVYLSTSGVAHGYVGTVDKVDYCVMETRVGYRFWLSMDSLHLHIATPDNLRLDVFSASERRHCAGTQRCPRTLADRQTINRSLTSLYTQCFVSKHNDSSVGQL